MPRRIAVVATALLAALATPAIDAVARPAVPAPHEQVVVLFKHQFRDLPATRHGLASRRAAISTDDARVRELLSSSGARNVHTYSTVNAVSATVTPSTAAALRADPSVAEVVNNQPVYRPQSLPPTTGTALAATDGDAANACPGPTDPASLEPEALQLMSVDSNDPNARTARSLGYDGSGVKVGIIADGIDPTNAEFVRPDGSPVIVDYQDFLGAGLDAPTNGGEAFLDASSIAAQGRNVYDISHFDAHPRSTPCLIRVEGVAPGASLVMLDPIGPNNFPYLVPWLQAIDYAVTDAHVDVLNESIAGQIFPDDLGIQDAIDAANDAAVGAGVTVVVCSGDEGVANTIGRPASDPNVIDVGGTTAYRAAVQMDSHGAVFGVTGWLSNNVTALSSGGFTQQGRTLDVVAPADEGWMACTPDLTRFRSCFDPLGRPTAVRYGYGTSEAAPLTAGVAALVIQAYARQNGGAKPSPAVVKQIITSTADDIHAPGEQQGAGLVDAYRAVLATNRAGSALLESSSQFNSIAPGSTRHTLTEQLTNPGAAPVAVHATSRALGPYTPVKTTKLTLDDATSPHVVDIYGLLDNYEKVPFTVPADADRLDAAIAYTADPALRWDATDNRAGAVGIALIDPRGRLASFSNPLSAANHSDTQVSDPLPGSWTAYIYDYTSDLGGTNGTVLFAASVARYGAFGSVSPAELTIPAGATRSVILTVQTPSSPGDTAGSLVFTSAGSGQSVPVTLRSLAHVGSLVRGVLTGGNGSRTGYQDATTYYQLDVPRGEPALTASIALSDDPGDQFFAYLVDPAGQVQASQSNGVLGPTGTGTFAYANSLGAALRVLKPAPGRWTLIINFEPAVSGKELAEPYTVRFDALHPIVAALGLPRGRTLSAGSTNVAHILVTNTGPAPVAYFIDPRLQTSAQYQLPFLAYDGVNLAFAVPSRSTALTVQTESLDGVTPLQIDLGPQAGDPYAVSQPSVTPSLTATGAPLASGFWVTSAFTVGPYPQPAPTTFFDAHAMVTTEKFDTSMSSPVTGDPWLWTLNPSPAAPFSPIVAQPGQTVSIPVDITPGAPTGAHVSGTLYIEDENDIDPFGFFVPNANVVAALPYDYTIG